jgi:hypothetical protein
MTQIVGDNQKSAVRQAELDRIESIQNYIGQLQAHLDEGGTYSRLTVGDLMKMVIDACGIALREKQASHSMLAVLGEVDEFLDGQVDVLDGAYGEPVPNRAMTLIGQVRAAVAQAGGQP